MGSLEEDAMARMAEARARAADALTELVAKMGPVLTWYDQKVDHLNALASEFAGAAKRMGVSVDDMDLGGRRYPVWGVGGESSRCRPEQRPYLDRKDRDHIAVFSNGYWAWLGWISNSGDDPDTSISKDPQELRALIATPACWSSDYFGHVLAEGRDAWLPLTDVLNSVFRMEPPERYLDRDLFVEALMR